METIYCFERGRTPHARTMAGIRSALEAEGLLFLEEAGVPVGGEVRPCRDPEGPAQELILVRGCFPFAPAPLAERIFAR
jgi:hypothetical protein